MACSSWVRGLFLLALFPIIAITAERAQAQAIRQDDLRIPAVLPALIGTTTDQLEATVLRPDDGAPHPLALINHGSPRDGNDRTRMSPLEMWPQAREFARRGWTAVIFMRTGFGTSEGRAAESYTSCANPDYTGSGRVAAAQLAAVARFMSTQPYVSPGPWISVGVSAGAFATVALTAASPPGLAAAIAFAPGRGSDSPDHVCVEERLIAAFADYGKTSRTPLLWVSSENDHFFGPRLVKQVTQAFSQGGGAVDFIGVPAFGDDGHHFFSGRGISQWTPIVDNFLKAHGLALRDRPLDIQRASLPVPDGINAGGRRSLGDYLDAAPHKAFAVGLGGHSGWSSGRRTDEEARSIALANCARQSPTGCHVIYADDRAIQ